MTQQVSPPPAGAIDAHVHVIDPLRFPLAQGHGYASDDVGDPAALGAVLSAHGLSGALIVQPSGYRTDNRALLAALAQEPGRHRGIAVLDPHTAENEITSLAAAGVVGIRLNAVNHGPAVLLDAAPLLQRLQPFDWLVQVLCRASELPGCVDLLERSELRLVFDHLGFFDPAQGTGEPGFKALLRLIRAGRALVKLSGAFRISKLAPPYADLDPFVAELLDAGGPERCLWGSDWPFVNRPTKPDYGTTLAQLERWLPAAADRQTVLVANPARELGFPAPPAGG